MEKARPTASTPEKRVSILTHGCKLNQSDSDTLARGFQDAGYSIVGPSDQADVYVVNTCTVTHVADRKARRALRSARKRDPSALVVATGCYAQRAPDALAAMPDVDLVAGNRDKDRLVEMVRGALSGPAPGGPDATGESAPSMARRGARCRAMVKIQEGCDQVCAYCIVPTVRGRERSIPPGDILETVRRRVGEDFKEVVLTGTQLGSYGFDIPGTSLRDMLYLLLEESGVDRLRVSSLQPQELTCGLLDLWWDRRLCPHFHMPLQSGSDRVLKRMRRRYTAREYADAVERVRSAAPDASITADVIVGFPGEDEDDFQQSMSLVKEVGFADLHVFPYSPRPGTSAAYMGPRIDAPTVGRRMSEMLALGRAQGADFRNASLGAVRPVLWERSSLREGRPMLVGLTDNYLRVVAEGPASLVNSVSPARLTGRLGEDMLGEVA
ncbi:MAG: tRNA (N(6)-L-threonylcarbamoyladenosine(37)-C(2))-methylthiotransferase MtaB [Dehalococcoidia bacterium]|nr:tRNA (N(6)-L-threonylcarbamoyladenosine(37)-C(2))-methylthiotransferase MtaB [Dehalococcoidia bacterium]